MAAEYLAIEYLENSGYIVLHHRYKTRYGELDLVMRQDDHLVFIEVKCRATLNEGLYALTLRQQKRLWQAGQYFLQNTSCDVAWSTIRFDIIVVSLSPPPEPITHPITHFENVLGQSPAF